MEKIIFFGLVIPIFGFVLYLGGSAIMKGFKAKNENKSEVLKDKEFDDLSNNNEQLSDEISRLNNLRQSGVLTQEEFEKAKNKILDN
jgi:multidrug resistance efflux pump